jgi:hypothetical protein
MRRIAISLTALTVAATALLGSTPASAMGSGNPYEDMQVGVGYTVYQPTYTAGIELHHTGGISCTDGSDEALAATYGTRRWASFDIIEGKPICADAGEGKTVWRGRIQGRRAVIQAYCDPGDKREWRTCNRASVAKVGGDLQFSLPRSGNLSGTDITISTSGKAPLTARQLIRIGRGLRPVVDDPTLGGVAPCTEAALGDTLQRGMGKGEVLVSVNAFQCADGWAYADVTVGDGKGNDYDTVEVFQAEGQFWLVKDRAKVCGTFNPAAPTARPADAQVPAAIWTQSCTTS